MSGIDEGKLDKPSGEACILLYSLHQRENLIVHFFSRPKYAVSG